MKDNLKKSSDGFSHIIIWLTLYAITALPQFFMIGMAAMATDAVIPEQSITNTIKAIPFIIIVTSPVLIPLIYSIFIRNKYSWSKILIITSFIIYVVIADLLAPAFGSYSISSFIDNKIYEMKKIEVKNNHPNKDPKLIQSGDW